MTSINVRSISETQRRCEMTQYDKILHYRHLYNKISNRYWYAFKSDRETCYDMLQTIMRTEDMNMLRFLELKEYLEHFKVQSIILQYDIENGLR